MRAYKIIGENLLLMYSLTRKIKQNVPTIIIKIQDEPCIKSGVKVLTSTLKKFRSLKITFNPKINLDKSPKMIKETKKIKVKQIFNMYVLLCIIMV